MLANTAIKGSTDKNLRITFLCSENGLNTTKVLLNTLAVKSFGKPFKTLNFKRKTIDKAKATHPIANKAEDE
jgi:hypothetical protein